MAADCRLLLDVSGYLRKHDDSAGIVKKECDDEVKHLSFLNKNETRWEGLMMCLQRMLQLQSGLKKIFVIGSSERDVLLQEVGCTTETLFPSDAFWSRVRFYVKLLEPVHVLSKNAQATSAPVMLQAFKWVHLLLASFRPSDLDSSFEAAVRANASIVFDRLLRPLVSGVSPYTKAAFLNPEIKNLKDLLNADKLGDCEEELLSDTMLFVEEENSETRKLLAIVEMSQFKLLVLRARETDVPFQAFWLKYRSKMPGLYDVACMYMSMPISSSKAESVFSHSGDIVSQKRTRFKVDTVEMILVIKDLIGGQYYTLEAFQNAFLEMLRKLERDASEYDRMREEDEQRELAIQRMNEDLQVMLERRAASMSLNGR